MENNKFGFGYIPDPLDDRDYVFKTTLTSGINISAIDLSDKFFPIKNQGNIGSCTAFATTGLVEFVRQKQNLVAWNSSPLFTYFTTRQMSGNTNTDSGATVRDALKSVVDFGVTKEEIWPYDVSKFTLSPPTSAYEEALHHQALVYSRINRTREDILGCLAEGYPFTFGVRLFESFIKTQTGVFVTNRVPMPDVTKEKLVGGHCMLAVGFITEGDQIYIKVRNSWGTIVGLDGYHFMPLEYLLDPFLGIDFWTIRSEEYTPDEVIPPPTPEPPTAPPTPEPPVAPSVVPVEPKESNWSKASIYTLIGLGILFLLFFIL